MRRSVDERAHLDTAAGGTPPSLAVFAQNIAATEGGAPSRSTRPGTMAAVSRCAAGERGVTMILVLWVIMVLSLLISGFAFTMQVETQVASFSRKEQKAVLLARSGVEVARRQLLVHQKTPAEAGLVALNQVWATNKLLYVDHELGEGKFNVTVADEERKMPINLLTEGQLKRLMNALQVDPAERDTIVDSILDWREPGDLHRLNGAKSDYYQTLSPPYLAKNGPLDRVEELLLIQGVTRGLFEGAPATETDPARTGLRDLLTTSSSGKVNVNTASSLVLQVMFDLDEAHAEAILARRDGPDGVSGTDDDQPYRTVNDFIREAGGADPRAQQWGQWAAVDSTVFTVTSTGEVNGVRRSVTASLRLQGNNYLVSAWQERRGGS